MKLNVNTLLPLTFVLFFLPIFSFSQEKTKIDSLRDKLEKQDLSLNEKSKIWNQLSYEYHKKEGYSKAIHYKMRELKLYHSPEDDSLIASGNDRLGLMYYHIGSYGIASQYFLKALKYFENHNFPSKVGQISSNLANVYTRIENHNKAIEYLNISLNIFEKKEFYSKKTMAGLYINIGLAHVGVKNLDSAMYYYNEAVSLISEKDNPLYLATALNNIGEIYYELLEYKTALNNYQQSYNLFSQINNENGMGSTLSNIAKVKITTGSYKEAIPLCKEALQHFNKINSLFFIVVTQKQLSEAYQGLGNHKQAMEHLELYLRYNDSLKGSETTEHIANLEMQYAIFKEQQKFQILEKEAELIEKENGLKQIQLYIMIGGIVVLLIITLLVIINLKGSLQRNKLKRQVLVQEQDKLKNSLFFKEKEIESFANYLQEKNKLLSGLKKEIKSITRLTGHKESELNRLTSLVNQSLHIDNDRKELELKIDQTHQEFINRLKNRFPEITKTETRLCSLLLLDLSSKEIATIMNIETASVKTGRNRLRKKLNLPAKTDIAKFLSEI